MVYVALGEHLEAQGMTLEGLRQMAGISQDTALPRLRSFETIIEDLDLSVRAYNCLKRQGVNTVGELVLWSEKRLISISSFGQRSVDEVKEKLAELGLQLAQ